MVGGWGCWSGLLVGVGVGVWVYQCVCERTREM